MSVLTASGLGPMIEGLIKRYRVAEVAPPEVLYVDQDCCVNTLLRRRFEAWEQMTIRLDVWHFIRRLTSPVSSSTSSWSVVPSSPVTSPVSSSPHTQSKPALSPGAHGFPVEQLSAETDLLISEEKTSHNDLIILRCMEPCWTWQSFWLASESTAWT
ncbi:hypothetical protein R3I94_008816 [Phoxinus phoxinus]